jgi:hypothetical protein
MKKRKQKEIKVTVNIRYIPESEATTEQLKAWRKVRQMIYGWMDETEKEAKEKATKIENTDT